MLTEPTHSYIVIRSSPMKGSLLLFTSFVLKRDKHLLTALAVAGPRDMVAARSLPNRCGFVFWICIYIKTNKETEEFDSSTFTRFGFTLNTLSATHFSLEEKRQRPNNNSQTRFYWRQELRAKKEHRRESLTGGKNREEENHRYMLIYKDLFFTLLIFIIRSLNGGSRR